MTLDHSQWGQDVTYDGCFETSRADVNGVGIAFTDWNRTARDTVLMIHGFGAQGRTWDPIAHWLASRFRVVCPDLRGHGRSDWSRDGYMVRDFAEDLAQLLEHLEIERVDIVGHSLGARVALAVAAMDRVHVEHVLLSDLGPEFPRPPAPTSQSDAAEPAEPRGYRDEHEALVYFSKTHPRWKPIFLRLHAQYQVRRNWAGKLVPCADPDLFWIKAGAGRRDDPYLWECCASITAHVHMMRSAETNFVDDAVVGRMHATMARFSDEKLECGHYVPRELPDYFCERLSELLARGDVS